MNPDPEIRDMLYQFVSSLIIKTKTNEMQWRSLDPKKSVFGVIDVHPTSAAAVYVTNTPDGKRLHFQTKLCQLKLVNESAENIEDRIEMNLLPKDVNLLKNLRDAICEQKESKVSEGAMKTMAVMSVSQQEQITH